MTRIKVGHDTRRGSTSLGTSIDVADAASERTSSNRAALPRRARASTGSSPARRRCWSARPARRRRGSGLPPRRPAAPTARVTVASAPARSRSSRRSSALVVAFAEVDQGGGVGHRVDQHRLAAQGAVGEACRTHGQHLGEEIVNGFVAHLVLGGSRHFDAGGQPTHHYGVFGRPGDAAATTPGTRTPARAASGSDRPRARPVGAV